MAITTEQIKELRDSTGVSVMQCKKALEEAGGDMEKALMLLKQKSSDAAAKKADRTANDGLLVIRTKDNKAMIVELNCETDFVAKNEDFVNLANQIADIAINEGEESARQKSTDLINPVIQKIGENIQLGAIDKIEGENIGTYTHNGKIAVVVSISGGDAIIAKDIAMHIAAMRPEYAKLEDVPENTKNMATELFQKEVNESEKPEDIKQKMLEGKLKTYFSERTLLEQPFIKSPDKMIKALLAENKADIKNFVLRAIGR